MARSRARGGGESEATSSTLRPCKSTAALRAAIVSLLSWADSFSKGALICGNRSKVVLRTTGARQSPRGSPDGHDFDCRGGLPRPMLPD